MSAPRLPADAEGGLVTEPVTGILSLGPGDNPMLGRWLLDRERSTPASDIPPRWRYGLTTPEELSLTEARFVREGEGVRLQRSAGAGQAAAVDAFATWDGRPWADPQGPAFLGDLVQCWRLDPHLLLALTLENVSPAERWSWRLYSVSSDTETLAVMSWLDARPDARELLVFSRVAGDEEADAAIANNPAPPSDIEASWRITPTLTVRRTRGPARGQVRWRVETSATTSVDWVAIAWDQGSPEALDVSRAPWEEAAEA